jgi:hypothetical protein
MNFSVRYTPTSGLLPHSGWAGATDTPGAVGDSGADGYAENAIARWDCVPYQTITGTLNAGVLAFHIEDIDYVKFSVDGGPWVEVATPTLNSDSGVIEYHVPIVAARFTQGLHELRAIAYPVNGVPRVLAGMFFYADPAATAPALVRYVAASGGNDANNGLTAGSPKATMAAAAAAMETAQGDLDGATIKLLAGTYSIAGADNETVNRWFTLEPAEGVSRASVTISGTTGSGFNTKLLRIHNCRLSGDVGTGGPTVDSVWHDGSHFDGISVGIGAWSNLYLTDTLHEGVDAAISDALLVRGSTINDVGGDAVSGCLCVVDVTITDLIQVGESHTNLWQNVSAAENVVLYDINLVNANCQLFQHNEPPQDFALVGCDLTTSQRVLVFGGAMRHYYVKDCTLAGDLIVQVDLAATNIVVENSTRNAVLMTAANESEAAAEGVIFR